MTENAGIRARMKEWGLSFVSVEDGTSLTYRALYGKKVPPPVILGFDPKDIFLFTSDRSMVEHPIVGAIQNAFEASFVKDISLENESFLKDHSHQGKPLVPAAYLMSMVASMGRAQFGRSVAVENFEIQNVMVLEDGHFQAKMQAFFREPHDVRIYSVVPHCTARLNPADEPLKVVAPPFKPSRRIDLGDFTQSWAIDIGPTFALLGKADLDETRRLRLEVDTATFPQYTGETYFDFVLALAELAFESITVQAMIDVQWVSIPVTAKRFAFAPNVELTRILRIRPIMRAANYARFWEGDILIENDRGEVVGEMIDVKAQLHPIEKPTRYMERLELR